MTARQVLSNALMKEDLDVISFSILFHFSLGCGTKVGWILQSTKVITDLPFPSVPEDQRTWVRQGGTDSWTSDRPGPQGKPCLRGARATCTQVTLPPDSPSVMTHRNDHRDPTRQCPWTWRPSSPPGRAQSRLRGAGGWSVLGGFVQCQRKDVDSWRAVFLRHTSRPLRLLPTSQEEEAS